MLFGLACCAIELMQTGGPRGDLERFGASKAEVSQSLVQRQLELESIQERRRSAEEEMSSRGTSM